MINRIKTVLIIVACIGVAVGVVVGVYGIHSYIESKDIEAEERMKTLEIKGMFEDAGDFVAEDFIYDSEDGYQSFDTSKKIFGVFNAESSIDVKYEGLIKAGYEFSGISFKVDASNETVLISLPQAEIISHELNITEAVDHDSIFNRNDSNDLIDIENMIKDNAVTTAEINGIYDLTKDSAEEQLTAMVENLTGYTVKFI